MATAKSKRSKVKLKRKIFRASAKAKRASAANEYEFKGGFPSAKTIQKDYDDADLNRAIQAYRFFYPTVSGAAIIKGNAAIGVVPNKTFGVLAYLRAGEARVRRHLEAGRLRRGE